MSATEIFGNPTELPSAIASAPSAARALAGFAPAVAAAAVDGDPVADSIITAAAHELATTAAAVVSGDRTRRVALVGGLTAIDALASRFESELLELAPDVQATVSGVEPVRGALALAEAVVSGRQVPASYPPYLYFDNPV